MTSGTKCNWVAHAICKVNEGKRAPAEQSGRPGWGTRILFSFTAWIFVRDFAALCVVDES